MKKFWSIFTVALVALSAVSCSNNFEDEATINGVESLSFVVNIDNTRTALEQTEAGWNTVWVGDETLVVTSGNNSFNFTNTVENKNKFTCEAVGVRSLVGSPAKVYYNNVINSAAGAAGMSLTGATEAFSETVAIDMFAANAFLKVTSAEDATLTLSTPSFGDGEKGINSIVVKGENVLIPVGASQNMTLTASYGELVVKQTVLTTENNKIYNLGTLVAPEVSTAWGTAGTHNGWAAATPAPMYVKGDYVVAYNLPGSTQLKFIQVGKEWDGAVGGTYGTSEKPLESAVNTWHNGGEVNILLPTGEAFDVYYQPSINKYNVVAAGATPEAYVAPKYVLSLCGTFNNWGDADLAEENGIYVVKNIAMDAYASFKIRQDKAWTISFGGGIVYMNPNHHIQTYQNGSDISITEAGTYDVYFNYETKHIYVMTAGTDYTTAALQTTEGKEPVQEEPEVTEKVIYLKPNSNWTQSNARFAIYVWGGTTGEKWVSMTASDTTGIYEAHLPEGYDYGCNIIFCRMNPSTTANNWNNKWNQTSDLKTPTDGKNLYTIASGAWDKGSGSWSVK